MHNEQATKTIHTINGVELQFVSRLFLLLEAKREAANSVAALGKLIKQQGDNRCCRPAAAMSPFFGFLQFTEQKHPARLTLCHVGSQFSRAAVIYNASLRLTKFELGYQLKQCLLHLKAGRDQPDREHRSH